MSLPGSLRPPVHRRVAPREAPVPAGVKDFVRNPCREANSALLTASPERDPGARRLGFARRSQAKRPNLRCRHRCTVVHQPENGVGQKKRAPDGCPRSNSASLLLLLSLDVNRIRRRDVVGTNERFFVARGAEGRFGERAVDFQRARCAANHFQGNVSRFNFAREVR